MRSTHATASHLYLSDHDRRRLQLILRNLPPDRKATPLRELESRLSSGQGPRLSSVPSDVITLNSRFRVRDMASGRSRTYTLEIPMPSEKPPSPERLSILDPVGAACMGRHDGDVVQCETRTGPTRFKVETVSAKQEAAQ